jgi:DnaJ-domain-containing protein 1
VIFAVLLGLVALIVGIQILRWLARADVKKLKRTLSWTAIGVLGVFALFLAVTGRLGPALALLGALLAWGWRIMHMINIGRQFGAMFGSFRFGRGGGSSQSSEVESRFLRMHLDHDTGSIDGEVREGRFAGRKLARMSRAELEALMQDIETDADSVSLLEAYLDRAHPDWREQAQRQEKAAPSTSTMTADEAYRILGLAPGADAEAIKTAYRRLMAQLHPDRGGTDYLAAKVNQAKDFLLKNQARK